MSTLLVDVVEALVCINNDGHPRRPVQWCKDALVVMVLQPFVEAALLYAFVNKQLGILTGDYTEHLDYVLVIDVP